MNAIRTSSSVDEIIEALGGTNAVATAVGRSASAVSAWRVRKQIPAERTLQMRAMLAAIGWEAPDSVFGLIPADPPMLGANVPEVTP